MRAVHILGAAALTLAAMGAPAMAAERPMAKGIWAVVNDDKVPSSEAMRKLCAKPFFWIEISDKGWFEGTQGEKPVRCDQPRWKRVNATTFTAPAQKCEGGDQVDGDGDGSLRLVIKGPEAVVINNSLYVQCR